MQIVPPTARLAASSGSFPYRVGASGSTTTRPREGMGGAVETTITASPVEAYLIVATAVAAASLWVAPYRSARGRLALAVLGALIWPLYFGGLVYYAFRLPRLPDLCRSCYLCSAKLATCRAGGDPTGIGCLDCSERRE